MPGELAVAGDERVDDARVRAVDLVGDLAEGLEVDRARKGGPSRDDEPGPVPPGEVAHLVQSVDGFLHKWVKLQVPRDREAEARELIQEVIEPVPEEALEADTQ